MLNRPELEKFKEKLVREYAEELDRRLEPLASGRPLTIDEIEQIALEVREQVGRKLAEEIAKETASCCDKARHLQKYSCPECERPARYRGQRARTIVSMVGDVPFRRRIYYCKRCDRCVAPMDQEMHLPEHSYTAAVEKMVARACVQAPFEQAVAEVERLTGVQVSAKEAQRITLATGEYAQQVMKRDVRQALKDPESLTEQRHDPRVMIYIYLDGIHTPMQKCWKESKVAAICVVDERGRRRTYYTHQLGSAQDIGEQLYALAARLGVAESARVIAIGDGAAWIWRQIRLRFPQAVQILDFFHASEHLYAVARACFGVEEGVTTAEMAAWVEQAIETMKQGHTDALIEQVKGLPAKEDLAQKTRRRTAAYFERHQQKMNYAEWERRGFSIGSGQIESGCKQVVGARMKGAGMRWKETDGKGRRGATGAAVVSQDVGPNHRRMARPRNPCPSTIILTRSRRAVEKRTRCWGCRSQKAACETAMEVRIRDIDLPKLQELIARLIARAESAASAAVGQLAPIKAAVAEKVEGKLNECLSAWEK